MVMKNDDGTRFYDLSEAETIQGIKAFIADPDVIQMSEKAGVDTDSQDEISTVEDYHIFSG